MQTPDGTGLTKLWFTGIRSADAPNFEFLISSFSCKDALPL
jgi:hypothetical protein